MGNGYNHHHLHHQRSAFLPMLCSRPSIKDVQLPKWQDQERSSSFSDDPSSPRVSCMGQVKRNNRVIGFPTSYNRFTTAATKTTPTIKYHKLKRLFSGKNLPAAAASTSRRGTVAGSARGTKLSSTTSDDHDNENCAPVLNIAELDPPLPVVNRPAESRDEMNLWSRRRSSGGDEGALKSLRLQQIHIPNNHYIQPPTV